MKRSKSDLDPDRYDANVIGPFDRCIRCFTPSSDARAYCMTCGHKGRFFDLTESPVGQTCFVHPQAIASVYCTLCKRAVCADCNRHEAFSFIAVRHMPQCSVCINDMKEIEASYFTRLSKSGVCAKHEGRLATSECVVCQLPLCSSCEYFGQKGFLFLKKTGPYCLACYRTNKVTA